MGTLYIDLKDAHIKLDGNVLAFYSKNEKQGIVPIRPLKRVVIIGNVTIDTLVLRRLAENDISVLFLSGKRGRFCGMLHGRLHNNGILRARQYEKSMEKDNDGTSFPVKFSMDIVTRKISAQYELLREAMNIRPNLRFPLKRAISILEKVIDRIRGLSLSIADSRSMQEHEPIEHYQKKGEPGYIRAAQDAGNDQDNLHVIDTIRGYEGSASAAYFAAYTKLFPPSLNFTRRTRRPPEDPVNAMLSLCYTLVHYEIVREIECIGLDPTIGFYHQFEYGRESLACDLVEIFRPDVDRFVWKIFRERVFAERDFSSGDERPGYYMKKNSRSRFYTLYEEWAKDMRAKFVEEVRSVAKSIMGEDESFLEYLSEERILTDEVHLFPQKKEDLLGEN